MEVSHRLKSIPPYVFAELDKKRQAAVARGIDVINLGIGDPDQPTPRHIVDAMHEALKNPVNHHYPPFGGMKEYKEAAAAWCKKRFGVSVDPASEVTSLIGSKEGLHNTIMAFIDQGDVNLIPDPAYPVYKTSTLLAGGTPHFMPLVAENGIEAIHDGIGRAEARLTIGRVALKVAVVVALCPPRLVVHLRRAERCLVLFSTAAESAGLAVAPAKRRLANVGIRFLGVVTVLGIFELGAELAQLAEGVEAHRHAQGHALLRVVAAFERDLAENVAAVDDGVQQALGLGKP